MRTTKAHGMRKAAFVALLLLGCGIFTTMYLKNRVIISRSSYDISRRIAETPVFSFFAQMVYQ